MKALLAFILWPIICVAQPFSPFDPTARGLDGPIVSAPSWTNVTAGLQLWEKFDETSGTTVADASGNGHTGTIYGSPSWVTGVVGGAISLNAATPDYVSIPYSTISTSLTVSLWFKGAVQINKYFLYKLSQFKMGDAGDCYAISSGGGYVTAGTIAGVFHSSTDWGLLTMTADGSTFTMYTNGVLFISKACGPVDSNANAIGVGTYLGDTATYAVTGQVDDLRIYNRALNATEVLNLYNWRP